MKISNLSTVILFLVLPVSCKALKVKTTPSRSFVADDDPEISSSSRNLKKTKSERKSSKKGSGGGAPLPTVAASGTIGSSGGVVGTSDGSFSILFPSGSFDQDTSVEINLTTDQATAEQVGLDTSIFAPAARLLYSVTVALSTPPLKETVSVSFEVPEDFLASVPATDSIRLFANLLQADIELEIGSPVFELINECALDQATNIFTCDLPGNAFADYNNGQGEVATLTLGSSFGAQAPRRKLAKMHTNLRHRALEECQANSIQCPLGGGCGSERVRSGYDRNRLHPTLNIIRPHLAVDFGVPIGTPILAVADGVVEVATFSESLGNMIILRAGDGSRSQNGFRYGHLDSLSVQVLEVVKAGQEIGKSGNTGTATTGPHLHFEYAPSGALYSNPNRIDPLACIGSFDGSITVGDNGSLADDAFLVSLNGQELGSTTIGQTNKIGVGNLLPGTYMLTLEVIIAPDDIGTYLIQVNDGLTFSDGSTSRSGAPAEGTVIDFSIVVPN